MSLFLPFSDLNPSVSTSAGVVYLVRKDKSLSWVQGTNKTFTYTLTPSNCIESVAPARYQQLIDRLNSVHAMPFRIFIECTDKSTDLNVFARYTIPNLHYLNKYYLQSIKLDIERYPNDESTGLATTMKATLASDVGSFKSGFSAKMYCAKEAQASTSSSLVNLNIDMDTLFGSGYNKDATVIPGGYSTESYYSFLLVISDGMESLSARWTVSRAFANVHLSGYSTGGVAFGRFSSSTLNDPKFECEYPAYFNAPVYFADSIGGINISWESLTPSESGIATPVEGKEGNGALSVGRLANIVFIRGGIELKVTNASRLIATIPLEYRPKAGPVYQIVAGEGTRFARLHVATDGGLYLDWAYNAGGSRVASTKMWVDCNMSYVI